MANKKVRIKNRIEAKNRKKFYLGRFLVSQFTQRSNSLNELILCIIEVCHFFQNFPIFKTLKHIAIFLLALKGQYKFVEKRVFDFLFGGFRPRLHFRGMPILPELFFCRKKSKKSSDKINSLDFFRSDIDVNTTLREGQRERYWHFGTQCKT